MSTSSLIMLVLACYYTIKVSSVEYNNWVTVTDPYMTRKNYAGAIGYDSNTNIIYLLGGYQSESKSLISYDISQNEFHDFGLTYFTVDLWAWGQFYYQRGNLLWTISPDGTSFNVFDVTTQTLTTNYNNIAIPINGGILGCLTFSNDYLFIIGSNQWNDDVQIYNTITDTWLLNVPQLQTHRTETSCAVINNEVYAIGGSGVSKAEYLPINDLLNIQNYEWQIISGGLGGTARWRSVIYDNKIILVGGATNSRDVMTIDPFTKSITKAGEVNYDVHTVVPIIIHGRFYIFGGSSSNQIQWMYHDVLTLDPTQSPSSRPTKNPTEIPSKNPTQNPTMFPTQTPSKNPSQSPTKFTITPTKNPTEIPTKNPSQSPTKNPTQNPTKIPTFSPTIPTTTPITQNPTINPSVYPSVTPTKNPTKNPSVTPTKNTSLYSSAIPTKNPTKGPTYTDTDNSDLFIATITVEFDEIGNDTEIENIILKAIQNIYPHSVIIDTNINENNVITVELSMSTNADLNSDKIKQELSNELKDEKYINDITVTVSNNDTQNDNDSLFMYIIIGIIGLCVICVVITVVCVYKKRFWKKTKIGTKNTVMNDTNETNKTNEMVKLSSISSPMTLETTNAIVSEPDSDGNEGNGEVSDDNESYNELYIQPKEITTDGGGDGDISGDSGADELYIEQKPPTTAGGDGSDNDLMYETQELVAPVTPQKIGKLCNECGKSVDPTNGGKSDENDGNWYCNDCWETFYH